MTEGGRRVDNRLDWMISVDDHVVEPPGVWQDRVPARYRDVAPRIVRDDQGGEAWLYEDLRMPITGVAAAAGRSKEDFSPASVRFDEMRAGCYDPVARVADMDQDGVLASVCFPYFPRFCGQTFYEAKDRDLAGLCVQAYNDWMIDEWAGAAPGRFIPCIILPLWDPKGAAVEIERCAGKGARAITFSENPSDLGLPSIHDQNGYWEPVFAAAADAGMPICTHIGSSSKMPTTSADAPLMVSVALVPMNAIRTCVDWLFSGIFDRHPGLKLCLSEGGIGWIPYVLERCEYTLERHQFWAGRGEKLDFAGGAGGESSALSVLKTPPIEQFRNHVFGCFIDDIHGVECLDTIGVDNVMIETDYPHTDSSWPHSLEIAKKRLAHRSDEDVYKIFQGNARRVFDFEPAAPPQE